MAENKTNNEERRTGTPSVVESEVVDLLDARTGGSGSTRPSFVLLVLSSVACVSGLVFLIIATLSGVEIPRWFSLTSCFLIVVTVLFEFFDRYVRSLIRSRKRVYHVSAIVARRNESGIISTTVVGTTIVSFSKGPDETMSGFIRFLDGSGTIPWVTFGNVDFVRVPSDQTSSIPGTSCTLVGRHGDSFVFCVSSTCAGVAWNRPARTRPPEWWR